MFKSIKIDHSGIKKLEGSHNFPLWKLSLKNVFWAAGIQEIVLGKEIRPLADPDKQRLWGQSNCAGMAIILQTVEEKLTSYVFTSTTANDMWRILVLTFGKSRKWTNQQLLQEFYQVRLEDKTPTEIINHLQTNSGQFFAMGYRSIDD